MSEELDATTTPQMLEERIARGMTWDSDFEDRLLTLGIANQYDHREGTNYGRSFIQQLMKRSGAHLANPSDASLGYSIPHYYAKEDTLAITEVSKALSTTIGPKLYIAELLSKESGDYVITETHSSKRTWHGKLSDIPNITSSRFHSSEEEPYILWMQGTPNQCENLRTAFTVIKNDSPAVVPKNERL